MPADFEFQSIHSFPIIKEADLNLLSSCVSLEETKKYSF